MSLFSDIEQEKIAKAIADAEQATSGEIRIAIDKRCESDPYEKAIAIIGDSGINKVVPADFWETTKVAMTAHFAKGNLADGIIAGVSLAGEKLALFFPYQPGDINELPNDIVYMDHKEN